MNRREWFLFLAAASRLSARGGGEVYSLDVCPWTTENPRHDHAQIFPLKNGDLLLAWSEYYLKRPSHIFCTPYTGSGAGDAAPCRISARVSRDRGRSWSGRITLQDNIGANNVKQPNLVRLDNGDVLFFFTSWDRDSQQRRVHMRRSTDDCETWSPMRQISPEGGIYILDGGRVLP